MHKFSPVKHRRRGTDLEHAILEEAWAELNERGYAGVTLEAVATRAGTSRTVLARRWDSKATLTMAAIRHQMAKHPLEVTESGNVREELLDYLENASARATALALVIHPFLLIAGTEITTSPQKLHQSLMGGKINISAEILRRAAERKEIDGGKLIPPITTLLSDLFRHYVIMNLRAPPVELRETWVDAILLPLVQSN
ncbi:TetR/AcrR family transcriptional regulator [Achromobacter xylosoxidans]